ncbi:MAG: fasciclin domain-containing protein [Gemmatimonadetes bacterium]|nr:fasciclin domain-containing protein [Gemmatimonadota bacterium]
MRRRVLLAAASLALLLPAGCKPAGEGAAPAQAAVAMPAVTLDPNSIAGIAAGSADHTTLVTALKAVDYVLPLNNPGPFTVFAPVNAAFDKLPDGTVETLLKPESASQLRTILLHHVIVTAYDPTQLTDGLVLTMLAGGSVTVQRQGDELTVGGAKVLGSVRAGNGMLYIVDGVMLPN